jgi:hypothetical protein
MKNLENWKEEFGGFAQINELYLRGVNMTKLQAFIESLLTAQAKEFVEKLEGLRIVYPTSNEIVLQVNDNINSLIQNLTSPDNQ